MPKTKSLVDLQGERTSVGADMRTMQTENEKFTPELKEKWRQLRENIEELDDAIERQEFIDDEEKKDLEEEVIEEQKTDDETKPEETKGKRSRTVAEHRSDTNKKPSFSRSMNTYLRGRALTAEQRSALTPVRSIPGEARANVVGTNTAGGFLVDTEYQERLIQIMKQYGGMWQAARIMPTATGAALPMPKVDETTKKSVIIGEGTTLNPTDMVFSQFTLSAYKYGTAILLAQELIQDDSYNIIGHITQFCGERHGRATNEHFTTGTGSGQPTGVVTAAADSNETITASTITRQKLNALLHSVDPAYRVKGANGSRFMFNDATLLLIKDLDLGSSDARPLWIPSMRDDHPDTIAGYAYTINQDMPDIDTSANKGILFGDFSRYIIREVRTMAVRRTDDRHIETDQVGFYSFARYDGNLEDDNAIKYLAVV